MHTVNLPSGVSSLRLTATGSADWQWNLSSFTLEKVKDIEHPVDPEPPIEPPVEPLPPTEGAISAVNYINSGGSFDDGQISALNRYVTAAGIEAINYVNRGDYVDYQLNVEQAGFFNIEYQIATAMQAGVAIEVAVKEGNTWNTVGRSSVSGNDWDSFTSLTSDFAFELPSGAVTLRLSAVGSADWQWNLASFSLLETEEPSEPVDPDLPVDPNAPSSVSGLTDVSRSGYSAQALDPAQVADLPVPAPAGEGMVWLKQEKVSDTFNYNFAETSAQASFGEDGKWYNFYHNNWNGPGTTYWQHNHVSVDGDKGTLVLRASRNPSTVKMGVPGVNAGCITSNERVIYPVFVEASVSVANIALASDVWLLSPDDTQEIDIIEAYGGAAHFEKFIHLSHHSFVRSPFTDYQPRDNNSWWERAGVNSWGEHLWNAGNRKFVQVGVNWLGPKHFEYYVDGELVRVLFDKAFATKINGTWTYSYPYRDAQGQLAFDQFGYQAVIEHAKNSIDFSFETLKAASSVSNVSVIDPENYQGGNGFTKAMDIIVNVESQSWHVAAGRVPSDADLLNPDKNTMEVDWIRTYKPSTER